MNPLGEQVAAVANFIWLKILTLKINLLIINLTDSLQLTGSLVSMPGTYLLLDLFNQWNLWSRTFYIFVNDSVFW